MTPAQQAIDAAIYAAAGMSVVPEIVMHAERRDMKAALVAFCETMDREYVGDYYVEGSFLSIARLVLEA